ncbi:hypothetical protein H6F96_23190 [Microcoleus sp. FACHB-53]|nr:hypothetical protein [Microcoleus sp. FACHB-53]
MRKFPLAQSEERGRAGEGKRLLAKSYHYLRVTVQAILITWTWQLDEKFTGVNGQNHNRE